MRQERLYALRGATQCMNTAEDIRIQVTWLFDSLLDKNSLTEENIVSVIFSQTADLDALNSAAALRQSGRAGELSLFVVREAETSGALPRTVRALVHCYLPSGSKPVHIYRNGAEVLRPDRAERPEWGERPDVTGSFL